MVLQPVPEYVGTIWFVFGDERCDPLTDHQLKQGYITWRSARQKKPRGARYFAGIYRTSLGREIHYQTGEYCEAVRDYVSKAAERLVRGEQFAHSVFGKLACPPCSAEELSARIRLLDKFEEQVFPGPEDTQHDPEEDAVLMSFELVPSGA